MTLVFYILIALFGAYELAKAINCRNIYAERKMFYRMNKKEQRVYLDYSPTLNMIENTDYTEYVFLIVGLFTSQWFVFLFVILLSLSRFQRLGAWATCVDALLTAAAFAFAICNKYQLL